MDERQTTLSYRPVVGWARIPASWLVRDVAAVAVDSRDRVYLLTRGDHPVIVLDRDGNVLASWGQEAFVGPHGISVGPDDSLYCVDYLDHTVRKLTADGKLLMTLGQPGRPADSGAEGMDYRTVRYGGPPFNHPTDVALSPEGDILVADGYANARVHRFSPEGKLLHSWGEPGRGPGQFNLPHGISVSRDGRVYVADRENDRIQVFDLAGKYLGGWDDVNRPDGLRLDGQGRIYVPELGYRTGIGLGVPPPTDESPWGRVSVFSLEGRLLERWGSPDPTAPGSFFAAHCVAVDSRGDLYVGEVGWTSSRGNPPAGSHILQKFVREAKAL